MRNSKDVVLLLTACVNPRGMIYTALQDYSERKSQYMDALRFYLEKTDLPVVFVENTACDFSDSFMQYVEVGRLEYLCFDGNNYDKSLGKGYGEALIINHAFAHSQFLSKSRYVVKITGRLIVKDICSIASSPYLNLERVFRSSFRWDDYIWSMLFVCPSNTLKEIFESNQNRIDDSRRVYFEHVLYESLLADTSIRLIPFFFAPKIEGTSGTSNRPYSSLMSKNQRLDNLFVTSRFYRKQARHFLFAFWAVLYWVEKIRIRILKLFA